MTTKTTRLTRQAAAERLQVSESTLDRMIRRGDLPTEKEKHGSRYKIWVLLDEGSEQSDDGTDADSAENNAYSHEVPADKRKYSPDRVDHADDHELTALRTEVKNLRELADYRGELLKDAEWRYQELLQQLKLSQETSATLARALPESAGTPNTGRTPRRRWWPFRQR